MSEFIYGLATTWNEPCIYPEDKTAATVFKLRDKDGLRFDGKVGLTMEHDYTRVLGTTADGALSLYTNDVGLYFRLLVNESNVLATSAYKKVGRGALRKASVSLMHPKNALKRLYEVEEEVHRHCVALGLDTDDALFLTSLYTLYEICFCNRPRDSQTFLTIDKNDIRLAGIEWDNPMVIEPDPSEDPVGRFEYLFDRAVWMQNEQEALTQEVSQLKREYKKILGGNR